MTLVRRLGALGAATALTLVAAAVPASPASAQADPPDSIASMGDSITRAFNVCGWYVDCPSRSYSTGTHSEVTSHYQRILDVNPAIEGNTYNAGETGAKVDDLPGQTAEVVAEGAEYVTVLMGANDACTDTVGEMTPVDEFRGHLDDALGTLQSELPASRVLMVSIPDVHQLWEVGHTSVTARLFWSVGGICQSLLDDPTSDAQDDVARRQQVRDQVVAYNAEIADACAAYGPQCRYDGGAVFDYAFSLDEVSGWDYFHPNTDGQQILADLTYQAGFGW